MAPYWTLLLLLLMVVTTKAGKYIYVHTQYDWFEAQKNCKTNYTDLAPMSNDYDRGLLNITTNNRHWIGLMRNTTDPTKWQWSGGAAVTQEFWATNEPNTLNYGENVTMMSSQGWHDVPPYPSRLLPSICYKVHAIRRRMTWYDALNYCRQNHQDLASVASETEMMLIKQELSKDVSSLNVWIGLQYLVDSWKWMDGQPFSYEAWGPDLKPSCPNIDWACGAIRVKGPEQNALGNVKEVVGWNALNCNQKNYFLCY